MIRIVTTARGDFSVRVVVGRVLAVQPCPDLPAAGEVGSPPGLVCTQLLVQQDDHIRELVLAHLEPIEIPCHRTITLVTGCEVQREWLLYLYSPGDKSHRRFDEHIRWFFSAPDSGFSNEADIHLLWSTVLLKVLPG